MSASTAKNFLTRLLHGTEMAPGKKKWTSPKTLRFREANRVRKFSAVEALGDVALKDGFHSALP